MSIFLNGSGTDSARLDYTTTFAPNPTRAEGGAGELPPEYTFWSSGLGDISADLDTYTNRNGVTPGGGLGAL